MPILKNEEFALNSLRTILVEKYNMVDMRLYGSKAKGTDFPGSDIDVMIVLENYSPVIESEIDDIIYDINLKHNCLITALFFSRSELEAGPLTQSPIYKRILSEGIRL